MSWLPPVLTGLAIIALFPLGGGYLALLERKLLADFQGRLGPMRVGPHGLLQPLADAVKLLIKEDIVPARAERRLFLLAPVFSFLAALAGFALLPFAPGVQVANVNVGLLLLVAFSTLGILGIILGGWSSNSHYAMLGALRSAAQLVSFEVALGLSLLTAVMTAGTLDLQEIVALQLRQHRWFVFANGGAMLLPCALLFLASLAETNRTPFDLPEAESELVAGYFTEFSGFRWGLYMLAEWGNILVIASAIATLFLGGWLAPFPNVAPLQLVCSAVIPILLLGAFAAYCLFEASRAPLPLGRWLLAAVGLIALGAASLFLIAPARPWLSGLFWFFAKLFSLVYLVIWLRATLPRVRYDQLMQFGWRYLIPAGLASLALNALIGLL